jgi:hypothetical protein
MFQTIIKLYNIKTNKIYFGGSIIYCDEKNICSVYYDNQDNQDNKKETNDINIIDSLHELSTNINTNISTNVSSN